MKYNCSDSAADGKCSNEEDELKPFTCPFHNCSKHFRTSSKLTQHIRSHTGEVIWQQVGILSSSVYFYCYTDLLLPDPFVFTMNSFLTYMICFSCSAPIPVRWRAVEGNKFGLFVFLIIFLLFNIFFVLINIRFNLLLLLITESTCGVVICGGTCCHIRIHARLYENIRFHIVFSFLCFSFDWLIDLLLH